MDILRETWPWWVGGPLIGLTVPLVYLYGAKKWGISSTLRHMCAATIPAGLEYFRYDWKARGAWQLLMSVGIAIGAFIATTWLASADPVLPISAETWAALSEIGLADREGLVPGSIFSFEGLMTPTGFLLIVGGGFLVGFGARYANGCTSGHAISGLSNLQLSSLTAVIGFFVGGLIVTHLVLPWVF
jgi:uncharacterized membrane protein YedE/YeeE